MKRDIPEPNRLVDVQSADQRERFAAEVLRAVGDPAVLEVLVVARVRRRLDARLAPRRRAGVRRLPRIALVCAAVLATAGAVLAARGLRYSRRDQPAFRPPTARVAAVGAGRDNAVVAESSRIKRSGSVIDVPVGSECLDGNCAGLGPIEADSARWPLHQSTAQQGAGTAGTAAATRPPVSGSVRARKRLRANAAEAAPGTVAALDTKSVESDARLLTEVVRKLRQEHDARGALELLDRYSQRFATGRLAPEAALGRVEALMTLGHRQEALRLIESTPALPLGRETTLLRGELRASAGRCHEAIADFGATLSDTPRDALDDRALFGRAFCRAHSGDRAGARAELERYLSIFPQGRFAADAQRALAQP